MAVMRIVKKMAARMMKAETRTRRRKVRKMAARMMARMTARGKRAERTRTRATTTMRRKVMMSRSPCQLISDRISPCDQER